MKRLINDFGENVASYHGGDEYSESIVFGYDYKTGEFENGCGLHVTEHYIDFDESDLTAEQCAQVYAFAEQIQAEMRQASFYADDIKATENSLIYAR